MGALANIVLVHGAWANGSSWGAVIQHLQLIRTAAQAVAAATAS
jgi:hypothetical protein